MTRRTVTELGVGLVLMATALLVAAFWTSSRGGPSVSRGPDFTVSRPGAPTLAPDFTLADLAGRAVALHDFRGRLVLVNLWATWCVPCREEMPALETLHRDWGGRGLAVLAVNHQEPPELAMAFAREYGLTLPVLLDPEGEVASRYRAVGLPATYLVDGRGMLVGTMLGFRDWRSRDARAYLDRLLAPPS